MRRRWCLRQSILANALALVCACSSFERTLIKCGAHSEAEDKVILHFAVHGFSDLIGFGIDKLSPELEDSANGIVIHKCKVCTVHQASAVRQERDCESRYAGVLVCVQWLHISNVCQALSCANGDPAPIKCALNSTRQV
jgi:hypothetical protein